jgi:hypothetical protein
MRGIFAACCENARPRADSNQAALLLSKKMKYRRLMPATQHTLIVTFYLGSGKGAISAHSRLRINIGHKRTFDGLVGGKRTSSRPPKQACWAG